MTNVEQEIPQKLLLFIKQLMEVNDGYSSDEIKEELDSHRLTAFGQIDRNLEIGIITPKEAQKKKDTWDEMHSYK